MSIEQELTELVQDLFNEGFNSVESTFSDLWQDAWVYTIFDIINKRASYIELKEHPDFEKDLVLKNLDNLRQSGRYNDEGEFVED